MPQGNLHYQIKHDGAMQPQTQQQHEQQLQNQPAEDDLSVLDIYSFNRERARIRTQSNEVTINQRFPTPRITPNLHDLPNGADILIEGLIPRPHSNVLATGNIGDAIWYSKDFQLGPDVHAGRRDYMEVIEVAYIANYLTADDADILQGYKGRFLGSQHNDDTILGVINEVRWKAKEECWSEEENQLIADALLDGIRDAGTVFERLKQKWPAYPKSEERLRGQWMEWKSFFDSLGPQV